MSPDEKSPVSIEALNDAIKEVGTAYDLLAKAAGLSDPEFWSLDLIWHGAQTQREARLARRATQFGLAALENREDCAP